MASLIRLYTPENLSSGDGLELAPEQAHYVNNVMRLQEGDPVLIFNGRDGEWQGQIETARKKKCIIRVGGQTRAQEQGPNLQLVFAPLKKQRMDFVMEKATELGVRFFQPIVTQHTSNGRINLDRLQAQVIEASEQCERLEIPDIAPSRDLRTFLDDFAPENSLFVLDERGGGLPIHQGLLNHADTFDFKNPSGPIHAFLIGPEGGFSAHEMDLMSKYPFVKRISVGPRILRAETAALSALSCWQAVLGDWQVPLRQRFEDS